MKIPRTIYYGTRKLIINNSNLNKNENKNSSNKKKVILPYKERTINQIPKPRYYKIQKNKL